MVRDDKIEGTFAEGCCDEPFKSIFKKSEHDEIMDELAKLKKRLDELTRIEHWVPYPYPYPYVPYEPYPKPYYYCNELLWTTVDVLCT